MARISPFQDELPFHVPSSNAAAAFESASPWISISQMSLSDSSSYLATTATALPDAMDDAGSCYTGSDGLGSFSMVEASPASPQAVDPISQLEQHIQYVAGSLEHQQKRTCQQSLHPDLAGCRVACF